MITNPPSRLGGGRGGGATCLILPYAQGEEAKAILMHMPLGSKATGDPPTLEELLALERIVRYQGSGLVEENLTGAWMLDQVWRKGSLMPAQLSAALLRSLRARLEIKSQPLSSQLRLRNSVKLGVLELRFEGNAHLNGRRPLLNFQFERLQIWLGKWRIVEQTLPHSGAESLPFFALIASGRLVHSTHNTGNAWLAARGRGGGLALWIREES